MKSIRLSNQMIKSKVSAALFAVKAEKTRYVFLFWLCLIQSNSTAVYVVRILKRR